jgi:hypothetical protein
MKIIIIALMFINSLALKTSKICDILDQLVQTQCSDSTSKFCELCKQYDQQYCSSNSVSFMELESNQNDSSGDMDYGCYYRQQYNPCPKDQVCKNGQCKPKPSDDTQ